MRRLKTLPRFVLLGAGILLLVGCATMQPSVPKTGTKNIPEANAALDKALQDYEAMHYQQAVKEAQDLLAAYPNSNIN